MSQNTEEGEKQEYKDTVLPSMIPRTAGEKIMDIYTPIKALSTFNYDWRIKARLIKKHDRKQWKNSRSEGYLLNIDLMDMHGT